MVNLNYEELHLARRDFARSLDDATATRMTKWFDKNDPNHEITHSDSFAEAVHRQGATGAAVKAFGSDNESRRYQMAEAARAQANLEAAAWEAAWRETIEEARLSQPEAFARFSDLFIERGKKPGVLWEQLVFAERQIRIAVENPLVEFGGDLSPEDIEVAREIWEGAGELGGYVSPRPGEDVDRSPGLY